MVSMRLRGAAWVAALAAAVSLGTSALAEVSKASGEAQFSVLHRLRTTKFDEKFGLARGSDGHVYGFFNYGGVNKAGSVFRISRANKVRTLHSFSLPDAVSPVEPLRVGSDGSLWGIAEGGGAHSKGAIYRISRLGEFSVVHSFTDVGTDYRLYANPLVAAVDGNIYGTSGDYSGDSRLFRISPDGSYTLVKEALGGDVRALTQASDGNFYGVECNGGVNRMGAIVRLSPAGDRTLLHSFKSGEGGCPTGPLVQANDGKLYGSSEGGPASIFRMSLDGDFQLLHRFRSEEGRFTSALIQGVDGYLYGANAARGGGGRGTIFRLGLDGKLTVLHTFDSGSKVEAPWGGLAQGTDGALYGTALWRGYEHYVLGVVYQLTLP